MFIISRVVQILYICSPLKDEQYLNSHVLHLLVYNYMYMYLLNSKLISYSFIVSMN